MTIIAHALYFVELSTWRIFCFGQLKLREQQYLFLGNFNGYLQTWSTHFFPQFMSLFFTRQIVNFFLFSSCGCFCGHLLLLEVKSSSSIVVWFYWKQNEMKQLWWEWWIWTWKHKTWQTKIINSARFDVTKLKQSKI